MRRNERVSSVMTEEPVTAQLGQSIAEASDLMREGGFHHLPVLDGDKLVGILTSTDLLRVSYDYGTDPRQNTAVLDATVDLADLMQSDVITVEDTARVKEAVKLLAHGKFHSLPVVDRDGDLVGIVTTTDLLQYLLDQY